jgi:hypothetical protein
MIPHPYVYEKLIATRHAEIQHNMQQARMQAQLKQRRSLVQLTVGSLRRLLIVLGSKLQRTRQQNKVSIPSS